MIISGVRKRNSLLFDMVSRCELVFSSVGLKNHSSIRNRNPSLLRVQCFHGAKLNPGNVYVHESTQSHSSITGNRISRSARTEAQKVLLDYLTNTRSFSLTDSDHISKNSPVFLDNMLSKIDTEKDVTRSLTRFLRYNPINEFEPFFESLGINPSELSSLLPRELMYLSDDRLMFENFHVLCNYGIPRSNIGKMYKEARDIFRYDYGVLASKLQAYELLCLSKPTVIRLVSCCPSLLIGDVDRNFVLVLEKLKRLGFKNDLIGKHLSDTRTYYWGRMLDTIDFLGKVGYSMDQLGNLLKMHPALVFEGSGKNVYLLFGRLCKLGFKMNELYSLFMENPQVLSVKHTINLFCAVKFLLDIEMGAKDIANIVSAHMELLGSCVLKRPSSVCKALKVGKDDVRQIIKEEPLKLFTLASKSKVKNNKDTSSQSSSKYADKTSFLLRLGYTENSDEMMKALKRFRGRGDQLQERFDCLVAAGLDCRVVSDIIKQAPMVLNQSKDIIQNKIHCLRNHLGYPLEAVVSFPAFLCYDMDRINHRFSMYAWLRERAAAKPMLSLSTILACSDARFVKYFVDVHPEGPTMWESLKKTSSSRYG